MGEGFDQNALSADELALLQAFETMNLEDLAEQHQPTAAVPPPLPTLSTSPSSPASSPSDQDGATPLLPEDEMLTLFVGEVTADITAIRQILQQLEPKAHVDLEPLQALQRLAHKIKGTTGSIGCTIMASIAYYMEELASQIAQSVLVPFVGLPALAQTVYALEMTLNSLITYGIENGNPLAALEAEYHALAIDIQLSNTVKPPSSLSTHVLTNSTEEEGTSARHAPEQSVATPFVRVELCRFEQLVRHTEGLTELQAPMRNAQGEVEQALEELHVAQTRLHHVEALVSTRLFARSANVTTPPASDERPSSSLVARILDEAAQRTGHLYQRQCKYPPSGLQSAGLAYWDALEMDHFTENDVLIHSLNEAIADVSTATAQLRLAFTRLNHATQAHMLQATHVRTDTLSLRLTPLSGLLGRIERAIRMSTLAQQQHIQFEIQGETTEVDQEILEGLKQPLLQMVRSCLAQSYQESTQTPDHTQAHEETTQAEDTQETKAPANCVWLHVRPSGNEVVMEIGFSMAVEGAPEELDGVQEALRRWHGSIAVQPNIHGSSTFVLRLPRTQGAVRYLLVRVGSHRVVVPFTQVQRIDDGKDYAPEACYHLHTLLGFPTERPRPEIIQPVLIVPANPTPFVVQVDEILGYVELVAKPLAPHLQRPGIAGTVIDGLHNVMLVADIPTMVRHTALLRPGAKTSATASKQKMYREQVPLAVLIADDSVYIRRSVRQTLSRAGYHVIEAADGAKALELLAAQPPDALVLDMEMPNLDGYDVLNMMRMYPELANVKVVMLTSRSSEKHQARARDLGAHAYLTKPCPEETLLSTLHRLLTS